MKNKIETKGMGDIYLFTRYVNNLSNENIDELTKEIVKTKNAWYIYLFARYVKNLSNENLDILTKAIIETKNAWHIYLFARYVKNLSNENIDELTKGIIETNRIHYICDFFLGINGLGEKNRKDLIKTVYNFDNCEEYLLKIIRKQKEKLSEKEIYNILSKIIKTKNKIYIAIALYYINDISLISQIFGSLKSYIIFLDLNMEKVERLGFKISTFNLKEQSVDDLSYSYVDDNIDTYFERETGQKVLS